MKRRPAALLLLLWVLLAFPPSAQAQSAGPSEVQADVLVYGTTTSGIGVVRGLQQARYKYPERLSIAVVTTGERIESPVAQGLSVEDVYGSDSVSGFYQEFRTAVISYYESRGIDPLNIQGRLHYEPEAAAAFLGWVLDRNGAGRPGVTAYRGRIVNVETAAGSGQRRGSGAEPGPMTVTLSSGLRITARYLVDASPEGDLGRALDIPFMVGRGNLLYDSAHPPSPPSPANEYRTSPQALTSLLTFEIHPGPAPRASELRHPLYDSSTYDPDTPALDPGEFKYSWSLSHELPNDCRELNEPWTDYMDPQASYDWVFHPEKRGEIRAAVTTHVINRFRYLQEHGWSNLGIANIPTRPYVREGVRFQGMKLYRQSDILWSRVDHPIAFGRYATYDRHDPYLGPLKDTRPEEVYLPMECLMTPAYSNFLMTTAVSADSRAYSSALRMEAVRANVGGAAGIMIAVASAAGTSLHELDYEEVRAELERQGYRVD